MSDGFERLAKYYCKHCDRSFWLVEYYGHTEKGDKHLCFCGKMAERLGKASWWAERR